MIIDCISDLNGHLPKTEGGDLLIIAGSLTSNDEIEGYYKFSDWIIKQEYKNKVVIAGNRDRTLQFHSIIFRNNNLDYLCDSGTEFEGLKIWGSPWTKFFPGMDENFKAFTVETEYELVEKFEKIPNDTDILITNSPAYGILDKTGRGYNEGSNYLYGWLKYCERPKLHVFGHINNSYGQSEVLSTYNNKMMISVNASHVNEMQQPVNKPIRIIL